MKIVFARTMIYTRTSSAVWYEGLRWVGEDKGFCHGADDAKRKC